MTEKPKSDKSGAPPCGLYMRINHDPDMDQMTKIMGGLSTGIKHRSGYAKNMHALEITLNAGFSRDAFEKAAAFVQVAGLSGFVAILNGSAELAKDLGTDGVLLQDLSDYASARSLLGEDAIIGLSLRDSIDNLDDAVKAGVDYVTLGQSGKACAPALLQSATSQHSDLLCAAIGPIDQDSAAFFVNAGASFLDCTHYVSAHPKGPLQGVVNILHEITTHTDLSRKTLN